MPRKATTHTIPPLAESAPAPVEPAAPARPYTSEEIEWASASLDRYLLETDSVPAKLICLYEEMRISLGMTSLVARIAGGW